jgi:hypothetical protein
LFIGPDGGRRQGTIRLTDKERSSQRLPSITEDMTIPSQDFNNSWSSLLGRFVPKKFSVYLARESFGARDSAALTSEQHPSVPLSSTGSTPARTSRADGSAYGYGASYRNRLANANAYGSRIGSLAMSIRRRRGGYVFDAPQSPTIGYGGELNFTQRLLMANENAVTNISDLWVSAAMNVDTEGFLESDLESESDDPNPDLTVDENHDEPEAERQMSVLTRIEPRVRSGTSYRMPTSPRQSGSPTSPRRPPYLGRRSGSWQSSSTSGSVGEESPGPRRVSSTSIPTIFSHSGVRTPPAILEAQRLFDRREDGEFLQPITESLHNQPLEGSEKPPSLYSLLPVVIIIHYGLLALHSTTHDQIFYLYLVSYVKYSDLWVKLTCVLQKISIRRPQLECWSFWSTQCVSF